MIIEDFQNDYDNLIRAFFQRSLRLNVNLSSEDLRYCYFLFKKRMIEPKPRQVLFAKNFFCPSNLITGLDNLLNKVKHGELLLPNQSKALLKLGRADKLFFDWGIHHFHLGTENNDNDFFVNRTNELLFAYVTHDEFLCLMIKEHGNWSDKKLIETIHYNWPNVIERFKFYDIIGLSHELDSAEYNNLRKNNLNSAVEVEPGHVYAQPGGGFMSDGSSLEITLLMNSVWKKIDSLRRHVHKHKGEVKEYIFKEKSVHLDKINLLLINYSNTSATLLNPETNTTLNIQLS